MDGYLPKFYTKMFVTVEEQQQGEAALPKLGILVTFGIFTYYFMQMLESTS